MADVFLTVVRLVFAMTLRSHEFGQCGILFLDYSLYKSKAPAFAIQSFKEWRAPEDDASNAI
jgi:hypothetical protein